MMAHITGQRFSRIQRAFRLFHGDQRQHLCHIFAHMLLG